MDQTVSRPDKESPQWRLQGSADARWHDSGVILSNLPVGVHLVEFVDVYPTLADVAGLPLPAHLEGTSFKPLLENPDRKWKAAAFSQYPRGKKVMGYSMRTDRYRLTVWVDRADHTKIEAVELYDHQVDPQENRNVAKQPANKELVSRLMEQWQKGWKGAQKV